MPSSLINRIIALDREDYITKGLSPKEIEKRIQDKKRIITYYNHLISPNINTNFQSIYFDHIIKNPESIIKSKKKKKTNIARKILIPTAATFFTLLTLIPCFLEYQLQKKINQEINNNRTEWLQNKIQSLDGALIDENTLYSNFGLNFPKPKKDSITIGKILGNKNNKNLENLANSTKLAIVSSNLIYNPFGEDGNYKITSTFYSTRSMGGGGKRIHKAYDFIRMDGKARPPIYAGRSGIVKFAGNNGGYGKCVITKTNSGFYILDAHFSKIIVKKGQKVDVGELIGYMGNTGHSTGSHLHRSAYNIDENKEEQFINYKNCLTNDKDLVDKKEFQKTAHSIKQIKNISSQDF